MSVSTAANFAKAGASASNFRNAPVLSIEKPSLKVMPVMATEPAANTKDKAFEILFFQPPDVGRYAS